MTVTPLHADPTLFPANLNDYQRMRHIAHAPITVQCSTCEEGAGFDCRSRTRNRYTVTFHQPRIDAVAHLTDDEKIAAVVSLRVEQARSRRAVNAALAARRPSPNGGAA